MTRFNKGAMAIAALALPLAACGGTEEETNYEVDAEDLSGSELQVADPDPDAVPVDLPETEMTNAPQEEVPEDIEGGSAAE